MVVAMSAYDFYGVAKRIARKLSEVGHTEWSERILNAIASGSTATEILMAIRWHLSELRTSKLALPPQLEAKIEDLLDNIDHAMKQ